jgi:DNA-binding NtrC family response regulator
MTDVWLPWRGSEVTFRDDGLWTTSLEGPCAAQGLRLFRGSSAAHILLSTLTMSHSLPQLLVIDDEKPIRNVLARLLADDWTVHGVADGQQAREAVETCRFDAVICDLRLIGESGLEVAEACVAVDPHYAGRILFLSGGEPSREERTRVQALHGLFGRKPIDADSLGLRLRTMIDNALHRR